MAENPRAARTEVLDRFYGALEAKDLEAARACCTPDVRFWHNFDAVEQDLDQAAQGWQGLFAVFAGNRVADVRRERVSGGVVQRHLFLLRGEGGEWKARPCCIFVKLENGLISRLDEYIDLSSDLVVEEGVQRTPGLPDSSGLT